MNLQSLQHAKWEYKKRVARLTHNYTELLTITIGHPTSEIKFDRRTLRFQKHGWLGKRFTISEGQNIVLSQQTLGFWGTDLEICIGNSIYKGKARSSGCLRVIYTSKEKKEIISYHRNTWKWKAPAEFNVDITAAPPEHVMLLLIAGYFTLRKLEQDNYGAVVAIVATT